MKKKRTVKKSFFSLLREKIHQLIFLFAVVVAVPVTMLLANNHTSSQNIPAHAATPLMPVGFSPGYNFEKNFGNMTSAQQQTIISQLKSNGVTWLRLDYWTGDTFDYAFIQQAEAAGIQVDALIEDFSTTPDKWSSVATQTVNTLKPLGVHTYEILNEVNSASSSAGTYTNTVLTASQYESILQAAYPAIKAADPTATVLFSGLDMSKDPSGYLQGVYSAGGKNYFDAVNAHPYAFYPSMPVQSPCPTTNAFCSGVPALYSVMQQNNDAGKKIWITEFGCPTGTDGGYPAACTDAILAQQLTQAYNQAKSWGYIGSFFMYNYKDDTVGGDGDFGVYDGNGQPKPNSLAAFQQIAADASGVITSTPTPTTPASISVSSLTATGTTAGKPTTFNYTLNTTGSITVDNLIVAIRDANSGGHDTAELTNVTLSGTQSFTQSQTLSSGTYTYWVAYETNGQWHDLSPKQTLVMVSPLTISNLSVKDTSHANFWSIQNNLQVGNTFYGDRSYTIASLPSILIGASWIRTANASKTYAKNPLVTFVINTSATVYIGLDTRAKKPTWLDSTWVNTGMQIKDSEPITFQLYKKSFPAGTVSLGQNSANNSSGVDMYTVIVN